MKLGAHAEKIMDRYCSNENYKIPINTASPLAPESRRLVSPTKYYVETFNSQSAQHISGLGIFIDNKKNL